MAYSSGNTKRQTMKQSQLSHQVAFEPRMEKQFENETLAMLMQTRWASTSAMSHEFICKDVNGRWRENRGEGNTKEGRGQRTLNREHGQLNAGPLDPGREHRTRYKGHGRTQDTNRARRGRRHGPSNERHCTRTERTEDGKTRHGPST